jgi:hypothetical protein
MGARTTGRMRRECARDPLLGKVTSHFDFSPLVVCMRRWRTLLSAAGANETDQTEFGFSTDQPAFLFMLCFPVDLG